MKDAKYYMRSPVGLFAKVAPHQELLIWALSYAKGRLVKEGKIQIFDDQGKLLKDLDIKETPLRFPLKNLETDYLLLRYHHEGEQAESFLVITLDGKKFFGEKNAKSASWLLPKQTAQQENWYNEFPHTIKVYGYSDRYLYRPGDTVHFAGFVHDLGSKETKNNAVQTGFIVVEMQNYADEDSKKLIISQLDAFGGFTGSFQLSEYSRLGGFDLKFIYTQDPQKT